MAFPGIVSLLKKNTKDNYEWFVIVCHKQMKIIFGKFCPKLGCCMYMYMFATFNSLILLINGLLYDYHLSDSTYYLGLCCIVLLLSF